MYNAVRDLLNSNDYSLIESFTLPANQPLYGPVPRYLFVSRVGPYLEKSAGGPQSLWKHQSVALDQLGQGINVVISTGTASGKSLIFRSAVFHRVLLNERDRVLVFYPLKALAADQLRGWRTMAEGLNLDGEIIGRIDGSVPQKERDAILQRSRIVIMTPDVFHAWMMSRLALAEIKDFLRNVGMIVLDEAHTLEGVFGSNFAFLIRRLMAARKFLRSDEEDDKSIQFIAATATIANPETHMKALTGLEFNVVSEQQDGSPRAERYCAHIVSPAGEETLLARSIHRNLLSHGKNGGFITFIDSRKGVESLVRASRAELEQIMGSDAVMPYRAGYDSKDRQEIEQRLQKGTLRGVVSTSALELGIDLPHLLVGINVGVPPTRKTYRQRLGRIGRSSDGAFLLIAPSNAFTRYGTSFREYHEMSVEPSHLYLDNRFMQFAHARCLIDELDAMAAGTVLPTRINWPQGFKEIFNAAKPGGDRPSEFDAIAQLGGDSPQYSYPLRSVGEINFKIAIGENADSFGDANESQALRECYPGGIYLHLARPYEVVAWNTSAFQPYIKVKPVQGNRRTRPRIRTWINVGIAPADLLEGHILSGETGFLAECQMHVTERIEGFTDMQTGEFKSYQELRQRNPNMRPRMRNFRTSGVILCLNGDWFRQGGTREFVADRLLEIFCREFSVLSHDVGASATNISVRNLDGRGLRMSAIVVFDQTYGSLRLTEKLFLGFDHLLDRLSVAADSEKGTDGERFREIVYRVRDAYTAFAGAEVNVIGATVETQLTGFLQVFTKGSRVCLRERGVISTDVEIIQPSMINGRLMYQVKCPAKYPNNPMIAPVRRWVNAELVEPSANSVEWDYGWWNVGTETYENPPESTDPPNAPVEGFGS
jgi:DEAD/DEAH box helicase domain-containing protein